MTVDKRMSAGEILNEVLRQKLEINSTRRYKPDATLFISEDCWRAILAELPREVGFSSKADSVSQRCFLGYTTILVKGVEQYVELKENVAPFDAMRWGMVTK